MIGLGKQADKNWTSIHGDRDVALMRPVLQRCGFKDIQVLINHNATKKAIVEAFVRLEKSCKSGDWVYVHFSGHGQLMSDREGDEKDGWDECWIPYDAYMCYGTNDDGRFHLTDDEVNRMLMAVRRKVGSQGKILVVVDDDLVDQRIDFFPSHQVGVFLKSPVYGLVRRHQDRIMIVLERRDNHTDSHRLRPDHIAEYGFQVCIGVLFRAALQVRVDIGHHILIAN